MESQPTKKKVKVDGVLSHRKQSTLNHILSVAAVVFSEHGFDGTSVRMICSKANVNVASINYYFGSKEALYFEVHRMIHLGTSVKLSWLKEIPEPVADMDEWESRLQDAIMKSLKTGLEKDKYSQCRRRLLTMELTSPSKCLPLLLEAFYIPLRTHLRNYIMLASKELPDDFLDVQVNLLMNQILGAYRLTDPIDKVVIPDGMKLTDWLLISVKNVVHLVRLAIEEKLKSLGN